VAFAIGAGVISCAMPLLRILGYESAMMLSGVGGMIALRRGLRAGRGLREPVAERDQNEGDGSYGYDPFRRAGELFSRAAVAALVATAIPYAILIVSTRFIQGCRTGPGTLLVLFLAVPAIPHLAATGLLIGALSRRRTLRIAALMGVAALHVLHVTAQALTGRTIPHSIPFGFLSASGWGGVGSTGLDLPLSYALQRGVAVAVCPLLTGLGATLAAKSTLPPAVFKLRFRGPSLTLSALPLVAALLMPSVFGLTSGARARVRALSGWTRTDNVEVRFAPDGRAAQQAGRLAADAEWDFQLASALMKLDQPAPVTLWVYESEEEMRRLTGARDFLFALPWRREVHTLLSGRTAAALRHELVHVLAGDWARQPLRITWNQALLEGTAEAIAAYVYCGDEFQKTAAAALAAGRMPAATELFSRTGFAWGRLSLRNSYRLASSFVGFLIERYGVEPLSRAYGGASWREAFGKNLKTLDREWRSRLEQIPISDLDRERAGLSFDPVLYPAFFRTRCPRIGTARSSPRRQPSIAGSERNGPEVRAKETTGSDRQRARGLARAARISGRAGEIRRAARALDRSGLVDEVIEMLSEIVEGGGSSEGARAESTRLLLLYRLAVGDASMAQELLDDPAGGQALSGFARDFYRSLLASRGGAGTARALIVGLDSAEGRRALLRALAADPTGPAAYLAAERLCSWPPNGSQGAAVGLYGRFLRSGTGGEPSALAAARLAGLALSEGRNEDARTMFEKVLSTTTDPHRRLLAEEGRARAVGMSGGEFVARLLFGSNGPGGGSAGPVGRAGVCR
jgi:hypothetical protein